MRFTETELAGVWLIDLDVRRDERGFFARTFCADEFVEHGLDPTIAQCNISQTRERGTVRGMHYQVEPAPETKLVRCTRGALHDVVVDLRPGSPTRLQHATFELRADEHRMLYVPVQFAHGFQTLEDDTEVLYHMGAAFLPAAQRCLRHDDPAFGITWPLPVTAISDKDRTAPLLSELADPLA